MEWKETLINRCKAIILKEIATFENTIALQREGLGSETKSSAGDKHETGRAMMQLEMEKAGMQLQEKSAMLQVIERLSTKENNGPVHLGNIVHTDDAKIYFLSVSLGAIPFEGKELLCLSPKSPIGTLLLGKKEGDSFHFRKKTSILKIQ